MIMMRLLESAFPFAVVPEVNVVDDADDMCWNKVAERRIECRTRKLLVAPIMKRAYSAADSCMD